VKLPRTEQGLVDRIRAINDAGHGASRRQVVERTRGKRIGSYGRRDDGEPKRVQVDALARLVERGVVVVRCGDHYLPGSEALQIAAANVDLMRLAKRAEGLRQAAEAAEALFLSEQTFVRSMLEDS
jgi:hypothetical protein